MKDASKNSVPELEPPEVLTPEVGAGQIAGAERGAVTLLWRDRTLQVSLILALLVNVALLVYLVVRFEALPDPLPLHFDRAGLPDRIEAKTGLFGLPVIGLFVLALNVVIGMLVHRRERAASMLLAASALVVQILMWLATINVVGGLI